MTRQLNTRGQEPEKVYDVIFMSIFLSKLLKICTLSFPTRFYVCTKFGYVCLGGGGGGGAKLRRVFKIRVRASF